MRFNSPLASDLQGYLQFKRDGDNLILQSSQESGRTLKPGDTDDSGCCVGIAQINVVTHLNDEKLKDEDRVNRVFEWITNPVANINKGVEIFFKNVKQAKGDLKRAYGYYYGDPNYQHNVCSGQVRNYETIA